MGKADKIYFSVAAFVLCVGVAFSATVTLKTTATGEIDWTSGANYDGEAAPSADDTVVVPANVSVSVVAGSASWSLVTSLYGITVSEGATFTADVPGSVGSATLNAAVSVGSFVNMPPKATFAKTGAGTLLLTSDDRVATKTSFGDYYINLRVDEGTLSLPQNLETSGYHYYGNVEVAEGATLTMPTPRTQHMYTTGLFGGGCITNIDDSGTIRYFIVSKTTTNSVFYGKLEGKIALYAQAPVDMLNTNQTFSGSAIVSSRLGVMNFGKDGMASSFGTGNINFSGNASVVYLGTEGETTSKPIWISNRSTIDGGAYGGLTFSGRFSRSGTYSANAVVVLTGSNTTECVLANKIVSGYSDDTLIATPYILKTGTGTWRLADNASRDNHGVIAVENGTLRFDSIAEKGVMCSLGYSDFLYEEGSTAVSSLSTVDYAILLGGDDTEGTFEYTGTTAASCESRPIAVKSKGRFKATGAAYDLSNVYALGTGEKIITLDGDLEDECTATKLSDGTDGGRLSVVKEGSGTWTLKGTNTFTGSVVAKGGKITVRNPGKTYRWYRFWITENAYGGTRYDTTYSSSATGAAPSNVEKCNFQIAEIAIYDADGNNLIKNFAPKDSSDATLITSIETNGDYRVMSVGEVAYGRTSRIGWNATNGLLDYLFDDNRATVIKGWAGCAQTDVGISLSDPSTWVPLVFRLPDDTPQAVRVDVMSARNPGSSEGTASYNGRNITAYRLDGSVDGLNWDECIAYDDALEVPDSFPKWFSDSTNKMGVRKDCGFAFNQTNAVIRDSYAFSAVGAANGGTLEVFGDPFVVSNIVVDASLSSGTVSNITFAANGTISVSNMSSFDAVTLPTVFASVSNETAVASWKVVSDGRTTNRKARVGEDGKITIIPPGVVITIC